MLDASSMFDATFYLNQNPGVAEAVETGIFSSGLDHFLKFGKCEGRNPSAFFDSNFYLEQNPGVANALAAGNFCSAFTNSPDVEGLRNVQGSDNINVEVLFNDPTITHSTIDEYRPLQEKFAIDIAAAIPSLTIGQS
jgi:hypothetical protein